MGYGASGQNTRGSSAENNSLQTLKDIYIEAQDKGVSGLMTSSYNNNQYDVSTDELVQAVVNIKNSIHDYQPDDNNVFFSDLHDDLERFIQYRKQQANIKSPSSRSQIEKKIDAVILYHTQDHEIPDNLMLILNKVWKKVMLNT